MLAVVCLAIVWACFLVPPVLRRHREGRPGSSVSSFRRQLSTLERATPGTSLRPQADPRPVASYGAGPRPLLRSELQRRRQNVLVGLAGATAFSFLLLIVAGGALVTLLFLASAGALGAYVYALVQIRQRATEAASKVRVLHPPARQAPAYSAPARRTAAR
jgi:hypothetical protein